MNPLNTVRLSLHSHQYLSMTT